MSRYTAWKKRQEHASPYANEANCRRCKHSERISIHAYCNGYGKPKKIPWKYYDTDKIGYCTEYYPMNENN